MPQQLSLGAARSRCRCARTRRQIESDLRLVAIDVAGGEERHLAARVFAPAVRCCRRRRSPGGSWCRAAAGAGARVAGVFRNRRVGCTPSVFSSSARPSGGVVDRVHHLRRPPECRRCCPPYRSRQQLVANAQPRVRPRFLPPWRAASVRKVHVPGVRRHVRTLRHEAHVAQVAVIDDLPVVFFVHTVELAGLGLVDQVEERRKRVAEIEAAAAAVADVEDPLEFLVECALVVELGSGQSSA